MSTKGTPTLPLALPAYQLMQEHLKEGQYGSKYHSSIRQGCKAGLDKLDKYHDMARINNSNILATSEFYAWSVYLSDFSCSVLHPGFCFKWFQDNWSEDEATRAQQVFDSSFAEYLEAHPTPASAPAPALVSVAQAAQISTGFLSHLAKSSQASTPVLEPTIPEMERYAAWASSEEALNHPLGWWKV